MDNAEFQQHAERIEQMVERATSIADEAARNTALELMQAIMDLHGSGLTRLVELLSETEAGRSSLTKLGTDPLICGLLVLYGIHPVALEERISSAIARVTPQLRKQNGSVELLGVADGVVRLAVHSSGSGCHSSPEALHEIVEQAIREIAPEVTGVRNEAVVSSAFVPLSTLKPVQSEEKKYEESAA